MRIQIDDKTSELEKGQWIKTYKGEVAQVIDIYKQENGDIFTEYDRKIRLDRIMVDKYDHMNNKNYIVKISNTEEELI